MMTRFGGYCELRAAVALVGSTTLGEISAR
jgi:hypothetical protein